MSQRRGRLIAALVALTAAGCAARSTAFTPFQGHAAIVHSTSTFTLLHSFGKGNDGQKPLGTRLVALHGALFGTTSQGGAQGLGAVFRLDPSSGAESIVYSFRGSGKSDGAGPQGGLVNVGGKLYGTTLHGGADAGACGSGKGCGTLFSVTASGSERVIHSFGASGDGGFPAAGPVKGAYGALFGTTEAGFNLQTQYGVVYEIAANGKESLVYEFAGPPGDGQYPVADLGYFGGNLYGTTELGGSAKGCGGLGCGTAFSLVGSRGFAEHVLHKFSGGADGTFPVSDLVGVAGILYGVTSGTAQRNCRESCGNVFEIAGSGKEGVLYDFKGGSDGAQPYGDLLYLNGGLYGVTNFGGSSSCALKHSAGCGTIFKLTPQGAETVLHSFDGNDGSAPQTDLIEYRGSLYGTTSGGGAYGYGTVFSITP
ncbi:MAG TPA: choice-of-anchor tandem repeat GloVer-containing protein [Candidatus Cybelea sp.]|jgi:uncharacterized repeat protein (TIGR03803 family)|nr:choice-of-anchor tandem repeat GloVer-containing protein [Candidatus Cybelea sp.]